MTVNSLLSCYRNDYVYLTTKSGECGYQFDTDDAIDIFGENEVTDMMVSDNDGVTLVLAHISDLTIKYTFEDLYED